MMKNSEHVTLDSDRDPFPFLDQDLGEAATFLANWAEIELGILSQEHSYIDKSRVLQVAAAVSAVRRFSTDTGRRVSSDELHQKLLTIALSCSDNTKDSELLLLRCRLAVGQAPPLPSTFASTMFEVLRTSSPVSLRLQIVIELTRHFERLNTSETPIGSKQDVRKVVRILREMAVSNQSHAPLATLTLAIISRQSKCRSLSQGFVWLRLKRLSYRRPDPGIRGMLVTSLSSGEQWRICHYLESYLRLANVNGHFWLRSVRQIITSPLIQTCVGQITSWQIRRREDGNVGAFRNGDQGSPQVSTTCAALNTLLEFRSLALLYQDGNELKNPLDEIGEHPVPSRTLTLQPPRSLRLLPIAELDFSAALVGLTFVVTTSSVMAVLVLDKSSLLDLSFTKSKFFLSSILLAPLIIPSLVLYRRRWAIKNGGRRNLEGHQIVKSNLDRLALTEKNVGKIGLTPLDSAILLDSLVEHRDSITDEYFLFLLKKTQMSMSEITDRHGQIRTVSFEGTFDVACRARALIRCWTAFDECRTTELTSVIVELVSQLVNAQQVDDRNGGWKINASDSRASVTATAEALHTLVLLRESQDVSYQQLREVIVSHTSTSSSHSALMNACSDCIASAVDYLRDELSSKLEV